jgi:hypothetical protein
MGDESGSAERRMAARKSRIVAAVDWFGNCTEHLIENDLTTMLSLATRA